MEVCGCSRLSKATTKSCRMKPTRVLLLWLVFSFGWCSVAGENQKSKCNTDNEGFSSTGAKEVFSTGLIRFKSDLYNSGHGGWVRETGTFTIVCGGVYSISFTGYTSADARLVLKVRTTENRWFEVVSTPAGGGSQSVTLLLRVADQVMPVVMKALSTDSRPIGVSDLRTDLDQTYSVTSFSAHRVAPYT